MWNHIAKRTATFIVAAIPLLPIVVMVRPVYLSISHLQEYAGAVLGLGATLCLLGCLAVTPLSWIVQFPKAAWWRKWLGLCVFFTGAAGLTVAVLGARTVMDTGMRSAGTIQEWTGTLAVIALLPLAVISNQASQKLLGKYWKIWQRRLTWAVWGIIAIHIIILKAWQTDVAFFVASLPLIIARIPSVRKDIFAWRKTGYADSARWLLVGLLAGFFLYGFVVLLWMEVYFVSRIT